MFCFFGEGACNQGSFHESLNMAAIYRLPVVFICENNLWALSGPFAEMSAVGSIADRAASYQMPGEKVDGTMSRLFSRPSTRLPHARGKGRGLLSSNA